MRRLRRRRGRRPWLALGRRRSPPLRAGRRRCGDRRLARAARRRSRSTARARRRARATEACLRPCRRWGAARRTATPTTRWRTTPWSCTTGLPACAAAPAAARRRQPRRKCWTNGELVLSHDCGVSAAGAQAPRRSAAITRHVRKYVHLVRVFCVVLSHFGPWVVHCVIGCRSASVVVASAHTVSEVSRVLLGLVYLWQHIHCPGA
ncbi:hypothetical protein EMIHUDRAFT_421081, partial [Emiliania huxleyi CCMP1516]|uniref:Uncharacterized protein n=2 Tax=Emiliania huxleyi TaxID=2903 RepID=A0A0D3JBH6_EMIH1